jgi:hypothetical protein
MEILSRQRASLCHRPAGCSEGDFKRLHAAEIHLRVPPSTIFATTLLQFGHRITIPAPRKTCIAPTAPAMPQLPHVIVAVVISAVNTCPSMPATAFLPTEDLFVYVYV